MTHQAEMKPEQITALIKEVLAEQKVLSAADIDTNALKTVATILTSFGIDDEDRLALKADFQHLRRWRMATESAGGFALKAFITIIVTGFLGALWLGLKASLGK